MSFIPMMVYLFVVSITPGPNNIMCMYLGANYGFRGARKFMIASCLSYLAKMVLCGALNVALAEVVPGLIPYLKWVGAAYMLYLAVHMLLDGFRRGEQDEQVKAGESTYKSGVLLQLLNVKSWVGCLSVFSIYVVPYTTALRSILLVVLIGECFMVFASVVWALCGNALRSAYSKHSRVFSVIMAASLIWCAVTALM